MRSFRDCQTNMQCLIEPVDTCTAARLNSCLPADELVLIRVSSDMVENGTFSDTWVVVTEKRVLVLPECAVPVDVPIEKITAVQTELLVGGGRLEIECRDEPTVVILYSTTESNKFSEVARGLEQLRKRDHFLVNSEFDRIRCEKCKRLLPEKNGICPACVDKWTTTKRIVSYMVPYKMKAIMLALASVGTTTAELAPPLITKRIIDDVLVPFSDEISPLNERLSLLGILVLALVGIRLFSWAAEWVHGWIVAWLGAQATADIRSQLYRRLEMLSLQFYDKRSVGALMARVTRDSGRLQEFLVDGVPYLVVNILTMMGILGFLVWMSWELTLYMLLPVVPLLLWGAVFWDRMRRLFTNYSVVWSMLTNRTAESLTGIRVVKAFSQEKREMKMFQKINSKATKIAVKTNVNRTIFHATISLLTGFGVLIVWFFGGQEVLSEKMTLGTLLAFYSYMWMVYGPLEWFGQVNSWMTNAFAGAERVFEVIDTEPESYTDPKAIRIPKIEGHVTFKNVTFGYDKSKPVLNGINAKVNAGEMIGLVGKSGVGKTTAINLIARFYDVDHGTIEIDGVDIRKINLRDLRSQIGIVLQEPVLFSGTIADNIGYGNPDAQLKEIIDAARLANAHNFIMARPDGYESQVGEQGNGLSGGERQRVAIARAMLHDPRILILDEATSSVDVETEQQIQEAIGRMVKGRTTFAIAHRLSTLRNADRLIVLDGGRIVQMGSHSALLSEKGTFRDLVDLQKKTAEIIAVTE